MVNRLAGNDYQKIFNDKYQKVDLEQEFLENCLQLNSKQYKELFKLLNEFEKMFDGILGTWKDTKLNIELK